MSDLSTSSPAVIIDGAGHLAADLACVHCGYNLRTQPVSGTCPECGHPVAETAAGYLPILDRQGHVASDLPCVGCGYNLRTQPATGLCPECAAPVARSARGHYLHHAPPVWVARLASGARLLIIAIVGGFVMSLLMAVGGIVLAALGPQPPTGPPITIMITWMTLGFVLGAALLVLIVIGLLRLTARDPVATFRREGLTARKLARYCLLAVPPLVLGSFLSSAYWSFGSAAPRTVLMGVFAILSFAVNTVLALAVLRYMATLMRRIPRPGLVTFARIEFWFVLFSALLYGVGTSLFAFAMPAMFAAIATGPNTPMPPYATGPNTPGAAATTSAPSSTAFFYSSSSTVTSRSVGPAGVTTVTTMPASAPMAITPPVFGPLFWLFWLGSIISMVGGCATLGVSIAGFVLLILVQRALAQAARQAQAVAAPE